MDSIAPKRHWLNTSLERVLPEQRLFLRKDNETRFVRLSPATQLTAILGSAVLVGWTIIATAILLMDSIGAGSLREQNAHELTNYEKRLNDLAAERDTYAATAMDAHERFNSALEEVSLMQSRLLETETRVHELESGLGASKQLLRRALQERDDARNEKAVIAAKLEGSTSGAPDTLRDLDAANTAVDFLNAALGDTAVQRDTMAAEVAAAEEMAESLILEARLTADRNEKIFEQLEDALTISVAPLDKMFRSAGLSTDSLLNAVRRGYSGQGGPLTPLRFSTKGGQIDANGQRANDILEKLDRMNLYRIAAERAPFDTPVKDAFRFTSGFGPRWGRMHNGTDFAAAHGTPIYSTADGVITFAGWSSGYGRLIKIQHEFGIETRYAHLSRIRVNVGQRVSKGQRIGDMGNTGRSTGTHLHYEVRVGGRPVNPMIYIRAAQDVF